MPTGKRLLNYCMPLNYKQGFLYPTSNCNDLEKPYGNRKAKNAGHIRKAGQNKLRKQLEKELNKELEIILEKGGVRIMKGKDLIKFIQENHLEDAIVTVTATMYYNGDHDCRTTNDVSINKSNYKGNTVINFYVDSSLY